jgi:hypothetical protein
VGAIRVRSIQDDAATGSFYRVPWPSSLAMTTIPDRQYGRSHQNAAPARECRIGLEVGGRGVSDLSATSLARVLIAPSVAVDAARILRGLPKAHIVPVNPRMLTDKIRRTPDGGTNHNSLRQQPRWT